jgi:hypothetical protein
MGRFASDSGGNFTPAPLGTHVARCYRIVDLGTQHGEYQGKPNKRNTIILGWELPDEIIETDEGPKPIIVSKFYTNSLSEKANLRHDLEAWRGRAFSRDELARFDLESILGKACMVTIVNGEGERPKVSAVSGIPKSVNPPPQFNPSFSFWLDEFSQEKFDTLSDKIQEMIRQSDEYDEIVNGPKEAVDEEYSDDEIPF